MRFSVLATDSASARRWESLLAREGWAVSLETEPSRVEGGVVIADWDALGPEPERTIRRIKARSILLSSSRPLPAARVVAALEAGADDHFPLPMDPRLLAAKIKAHLRRLGGDPAEEAREVRSPGGAVRLDRSRQQAWVRASRGRWDPVEDLTPTEFRFLDLFLSRPGAVLERRVIVETLWKEEADLIRPGTVDKHVEALRRKLGRAGELIRTVYGSGYAFREGS